MRRMPMLMATTLLVFAAGCYDRTKTIFPYARSVTANEAPIAQDLIASTVVDATESSLARFKENVANKRVCVEVNGISHGPLATFLQGSVEAKLASSGALVVPCCSALLSVSARAGGPAPEGAAPAPHESSDSCRVDYRALVNVQTGGIDATAERTVDGGKAAAQVLLISAPAILMPVAAGVSAAADDDDATVAAFGTMAPIASSALIAGIIWMSVSPPYDYQTHLDARLDATVHLLPQTTGLVYDKAQAKGTKRRSFDEDSDEVIDSADAIPRF